MRGVMVCPECGERTNIELNREFSKVRCQNCGRLMDRKDNLEKSES